MSSSSNIDSDVDKDISYKPGTFRYQDLPSDKRRKLFDERQRELNPCLKESEMADACLLRAGEDYHQCNAQVENYKTCKRFWNAVRMFAAVNHLARNDSFPPLEERPIWKKQLPSWIQTKKLTVPEELKPVI